MTAAPRTWLGDHPRQSHKRAGYGHRSKCRRRKVDRYVSRGPLGAGYTGIRERNPQPAQRQAVLIAAGLSESSR